MGAWDVISTNPSPQGAGPVDPWAVTARVPQSEYDAFVNHTGTPGQLALGGGAPGHVLQGVFDTGAGLVQLAGHGLSAAASLGGHYPNVVSKTIDKINNAVDNTVTSENQYYENARKAAGNSGPDFARAAGFVVSPATGALTKAAGLIPRAADAIPETVAGSKLLAGGAKTAADIAQGAGIGGGFGATAPVTDQSQPFWQQKGEQAESGAALGGALSAATPIALGAYNGAKNAVNAFRPAGRENIVGRILNESAGTLPATPQEPPLPGMQLTTGQATNNPGLLWLERSVQQSNPAAAEAMATSRTSNNQAITDAIKSLGSGEQNPSPAMRSAVVAAQPDGSPVSRIMDSARSGISDGNYYGNIQQLMQQRSANSRPAYEAALDVGPVHTDRTAQFLAHPILQKGLAKGIRIQSLEALAEGKPFNPSDYAVTGFNAAGDPILGPVPNMRTLDAAKKGLDDIVEQYRDQVTGKLHLDQEGRAVDNVRRAYLKELDTLNPLYKTARQQYSGPSQSLDALYAGRNIFNPDAEQVAQRFDNLSDGDKEFFRAGVMRAIEDKANNSPNPQSAIKSLLSKPAVQEKLRMAFNSPEEFSSFMGNANREFSQQPDIAKVTATNPAGEFKAPESSVADQFIRAGRGAPEALHAYLNAVGNDEGGLQAARDAFTQKFLKEVQTTQPDLSGNSYVSPSWVKGFLNDYSHVVNSRLFTDAQRDLMRRIGDAADMGARTARAGAPGGSDTFAKLSGKNFIDALIGPMASKVMPVGGAVLGAHFGFTEGGVGGALAGLWGGNHLAEMLYAAPREKVLNLLNEAMSDPKLAQALMQKVRPGSDKLIPQGIKNRIFGILGSEPVESHPLASQNPFNRNPGFVPYLGNQEPAQ